MNTRRMTIFLAGGTLALTTSACATETTTTESGANVIKDGTLTVCTSLPYEPFEFEKGNEIVGFDMDLVKKVADANDLDMSIVVTGFEGIQSGQALNSGKCDIAAAGMTITDERAKVIDFTDPYFDATQALLTKDKSLDSLESLDGKTLGVMTGTTGEMYAKENAPDGVTLKSFENLGLQTSAVKSGQIDAIIQDNGPLLDYANKNSDTFVTAEFDTGEQYGFAVKKDSNADLLDSANTVIADSKSDGSYDEIYEKWFGQAPDSSDS
ncbi:transporter substrate-binding domain-containing protein [Phycicoccus endophyticus]|uniref:Transporter substrate-binding domain-containing protein n=1 Tax=Phycicoccus endophyticus TaxID=1690220 RepID=A0A7G9R4M0_9MICO|nr:transporter substrate-binding domain-containing protein [Phycicoccus endophyticus]NHI18442.1 transporter substrate-binding domain-containing protein [Phycicoccus endophyticus]QNN50545.1 transporter substrate-binding domain-containing protein [Phycicoccus endophyticus]GGL23740.1 basic amino acid ABC transporter substrate-binding protein [Phycicoccus endophyticus]